MRAGSYLIGAALVAVTAGSLAVAAAGLRSLLLPSWTGAPARLAEAVLAVGVLVVSAQVLAVADLLDRVPIVVVSVGTAGGVQWARRRWTRGAEGADELAEANPPPRWTVVLALASVALLAAQWGARVAEAYGRGIADADSLGYHLSFAAEFARGGSPLSLHFVAPDLGQVFHPANSELVHAVGMALTGGDLVSPLLNLGWVGLALLAGWCLGRRWGAAPVGLLGVAAALGTPIMAISHAGTAVNDTAATALLLAAAALLAHARIEPSPSIAVAGLAAGLALGTKLTVVAAVALLAVAIPVLAPAGRRLRTALAWAGPVVVGGGIWYVRNLVRTGNPVPALDLGVFPSPPLRLIDDFGYAVSDYLFEPRVWRRIFVPGLEESFGPLWAVLVAAAVVLVVAVVVRGRGRIERWLAGAAAVAMLAYLVTPTTAFGEEGRPSGIFFSANLRYVVPAVALALALVPAARLPEVLQRWTPVALAALLAVAQFDGGLFPAWPDDHRLAGVLIGVATMAGIVAARRVGAAPVGLAALVAVAAVGWPAVDGYIDDRYRELERPAVPAYRWAAETTGARIGLAGFFQQYPLFGPRLDNHVRYVGHRGPHGEFTDARSCREWRTLLARGRYRYVVTAPSFTADEAEPPAAEWTRDDPGAIELLKEGPATVFRLDAAPDPAAC